MISIKDFAKSKDISVAKATELAKGLPWRTDPTIKRPGRPTRMYEESDLEAAYHKSVS